MASQGDGLERRDDENLRIAIVADNASARFGGEAILPLHYFRRLRRRGVEAWLVTHARVMPELRETLTEQELARVRAVPDLLAHKALYRVGSRLPHRVHLATTGLAMLGLTEVIQRRMVRDLVREQGIQVVHVPTPVSPKTPSSLYDVGAPVVFGPMNGGMSFPPGFGYQGSLERHLTRAGRAAATVFNQLVPGKRKAAALVVANPRTRDALPAGVCENVIELVENGVDLELFQPPGGERSPRERPRFVFLGRLVDWKAVDLLLEALAAATERVDMELHIVGDGEERPRLQQLSQELGLGERVVFHGFVPQSRCPTILADADALVLPSVYECGGAVVLEAMAMGVPVLATRWGGPADYLDDETGVLVDPDGPETFVRALTEGLVRLARDPALRARLSDRGRARVETLYDWERKMDRMLEIYRSVA